jgi:hypothetical protein
LAAECGMEEVVGVVVAFFDGDGGIRGKDWGGAFTCDDGDDEFIGWEERFEDHWSEVAGCLWLVSQLIDSFQDLELYADDGDVLDVSWRFHGVGWCVPGTEKYDFGVDWQNEKSFLLMTERSELLL